MYGMGAGPFSGMKGSGFLKGLMGASRLSPGALGGKTKGLGGFLSRMTGGAGKWWG